MLMRSGGVVVVGDVVVVVDVMVFVVGDGKGWDGMI